MPNGDALNSGKYSVSVALKDLTAKSGIDHKIIAKGDWKSEIPLNFKNASKTITLKNATVQGSGLERPEKAVI